MKIFTRRDTQRFPSLHTVHLDIWYKEHVLIMWARLSYQWVNVQILQGYMADKIHTWLHQHKKKNQVKIGKFDTIIQFFNTERKTKDHTYVLIMQITLRIIQSCWICIQHRYHCRLQAYPTKAFDTNLLFEAVCMTCERVNGHEICMINNMQIK